MVMRALLDADMPAHEVGHIHEGTGKFDEEGNEIKRLISWEECRKVAVGLFNSILHRSGASAFEAYVSGGTNFRHQIATLLPYKGNRDYAERHWADEVKTCFEEEFGAIRCLDYEADDAIAMRQWAHWSKLMERWNGDETAVANDMDTVICSRDKDLLNVPGWHFRWSVRGADDAKPFYQPLLSALKHFYKQMLVGDSADNIKGLYNVGEKSAWVQQLDEMTNEDEMAAHVHDKYEKYYGEYATQFFHENGNLLHMWRRPRDVWLPPWDRDESYYNI